MLTIVKQQETLSLAKDIVSGKENIGMIENSLTIKSAYECPTIKNVFRENNQIAFAVVQLLVQRFLSSFGFATKHSETQIEIITTDLLDNFKYESLQDIILFLKMARNGKFGTTARGLDSNLIMGDWMPKYLELKAEERERQYTLEKHQPHNEAVENFYKKMQRKKEHEQKEKDFRDYVEKMTKGITREQLEILIKKVSLVEEAAPFLYILKLKRREIK